MKKEEYYIRTKIKALGIQGRKKHLKQRRIMQTYMKESSETKQSSQNTI